MLRVLAFIEHNFHWDSLDDLDVIAGGILGRQQTIASACGAPDIENMPLVGSAVSVDRNLCGLPRLHIGQLRFFKVRCDPDVLRIERDDGHELLTWGDVLAGLHRALTYDSTYGRNDSCVLQIELSLLQGRLCLLRLGIGSLGAGLLHGDLLRTRLSIVQFSFGLRDASTRASYRLFYCCRGGFGGLDGGGGGFLSIDRLELSVTIDDPKM